MLRTLLVLEPGTRADGRPCLRGTLSRSLLATDHKGGERLFPRGTPLLLIKNQRGGTYSLLAQLPDEDEPDHLADARREAAAMQGDVNPF